MYELVEKEVKVCWMGCWVNQSIGFVDLLC